MVQKVTNKIQTLRELFLRNYHTFLQFEIITKLNIPRYIFLNLFTRGFQVYQLFIITNITFTPINNHMFL